MPVQEYADAMERQLAILVGFARQINELDLAGCVMMEMRGMQDAGWNTGATAFEVHAELSALCTLDRPVTRQEFRSALALYMQLAEAGGVYEGLKSMLQIIELKPYSMWPFQPLVRHRANPPAVIGPNANRMFRDLATVADGIGMTKLSELLSATFRDDIRNGVAHADYVIWNNNLRLRRRNGGQVVVLPLQEVGDAMGIGLNFFLLLRDAVKTIVESFRPGRTIFGRFTENVPAAWHVEWQADGRFRISNAPGNIDRAVHQRQQRINDKLGGKVLAVYVTQVDAAAAALVDHIAAEGFEAAVVEVPEDQLTALATEVQTNAMWDGRAEAADQGTLLVSPFGFRRITDVNQFASVLPELPDEADGAEEGAPAAVAAEGA